jgi:hypothetical protein
MYIHAPKHQTTESKGIALRNNPAAEMAVTDWSLLPQADEGKLTTSTI